MAVGPEDVIRIALPESELDATVAYAYHVLTHTAGEQDRLGFLIQTMMDELGERMILHWLRSNGKWAESAHDKGATVPDLRHEIRVKDIRGREVLAGVWTYLSVNRSEISEILEEQNFHLEPDRVCGINFAVCFWLQLSKLPEIKIPTLSHAAIIGWVSDKNLRQGGSSSSGNQFKPFELKFCNLRPADELLQYLV